MSLWGIFSFKLPHQRTLKMEVIEKFPYHTPTTNVKATPSAVVAVVAVVAMVAVVAVVACTVT